MRASVLFFALCCVAVGAQAKCPYARYTVDGSLQLPPGVPTERVRIYLVVDGMSRASDYAATAEKPDFELPSAEGHFQLEAWVSTASGDPDSSREECKRAEIGGEVFVTGDGIYARRVRVTFRPTRREILKELEAFAQVGPVAIERLPQ